MGNDIVRGTSTGSVISIVRIRWVHSQSGILGRNFFETPLLHNGDFSIHAPSPWNWKPKHLLQHLPLSHSLLSQTHILLVSQVRQFNSDLPIFIFFLFLNRQESLKAHLLPAFWRITRHWILELWMKMEQWLP